METALRSRWFATGRAVLIGLAVVAAAVLVSYFSAGGTVTIVDASGAFTSAFNQGLYGIGIAGVGMLRKAGYEVKFRDFFKIGIPFTLAAVLGGYLFVWFFWHP